MYWIISFALLIPLFIIESISTHKQKNVIKFLSFFIFTLIITGSYYNGIDWINYIKYYQYISKYGIDSPLAFVYEPGFACLNWIFSYVLSIKNYHVIPFFCNILFSISLLFSLKKIPIRINVTLYLLLLLLFLTALFNDGYRQLLSLSILLPFIFKIDKISFLKWALVCIIAGLFHSSSLLLIPFWLILRLNFTKNKIYYSFILTAFFTLLLSNLTELVNLFEFIIPSLLYNKLINYMALMDGNFRFGFFVIFDILGIIFCLHSRKNDENKLLWNVLFIYFLCHFSFYFTPFFQRLLFYFYPLLILYIFNKRRDLSYFILSFIIISIGILSFYKYITNPYYSSDFWEPKFFYLYLPELVELDLNKLEAEKCSVISKYDDNFCR